MNFSLWLNTELGEPQNWCHTEVADVKPHRFVNVHLLNLQDGSPHQVPLRKVLSLEFEHYRGPLGTAHRISGSRIALGVEFQDFTPLMPRKELIVWNWRTGEVVNRSPSFSETGFTQLDSDTQTLDQRHRLYWLGGRWELHFVFLGRILAFSFMLSGFRPSPTYSQHNVTSFK